MAKMKPTKSTAQKAAKRTAANGKSAGFTAEERTAMRDRVQELKAARAGKKAGTGDDEPVVLAKIASMPAADRAIGERLHAIIKAAAPNLTSRLWYGMPAYSKDDKVICFFQGAHKFKARYATFGFMDKAALDEGDMWPTGFAVKKLTPADEARIAALVKKAVS